MTTNQVVDGATLFRQRLLPRTLEHGTQIDFYREHWGTAATSGQLNLAGLPTVSKQRNGVQLEAARHPKLRPALLMQTSGTTGRPFRQYRSQEELDAYNEYIRARMAKASRTEAARPVLAFNTVPMFVHGAAVDAQQLAYRFSIDVLSEEGQQNALGLMRDPSLFSYEGVTPTRLVSGSPHMLVALTAACDVNGIDPAELGIDELYSVSDVLTGSTRRFLERRWVGSQVRDVFSASEVTGAAAACEDCQGYHYEPIVWPEILDLDRDEPSQGDIGELTLTELYPFAQLQPKLRYRTGDIVRRLDCPARPGDLAFAPLGRRHSCPTVVVDGRTHVLIGGVTLREVLEDDPGVARETVPDVAHPLISQLPAGPARAEWGVRADGDVVRVELAVAAAFSVGMHPDGAVDLRQRLTGRLNDVISVPAGVSAVLDVTVRESYTLPWGLCVRPLNFDAPATATAAVATS